MISAPQLAARPFESTAPDLRWRANHTHGAWHLVVGGWRQVRLLVGALDGNGWPWATIERVDTDRWFQTLGAADACVLELGSFGATAPVYSSESLAFGWAELPAECAYWFPAIRSDELLTADEASGVGMRWLLEPWGAWGLRPSHFTPHRH